jgi:hypothetical protein
MITSLSVTLLRRVLHDFVGVVAAGLLLLFLALPAGPARAGAWTQPARSYYAKIETALGRADTEFDSRAREVPYAVDSLKTRPADYRNLQVRGYLEYGIADRLTGVVSLSYQRIEAEEKAARHRTFGFSDLRVGTRYALSRTGVVTALAVEAKIPTGYRQNAFPALGSHAADLAISYQAGGSFPGGYATAEAGLNLRSGHLANEIPFSLEVGLHPVPRTQIRGVLRGRRSLGTIEAAAGTDLARVDSRVLDLAAALVYAVRKDADIEAGWTRTLEGRNTLIGTEISLGLAVHR